MAANFNTLAIEAIEVVVQGLEKAEAEIDRLKGKVGQTKKVTVDAGSFARSMGSAIAGAVSAPSRLLGGLYSGLRRVGEQMEAVGTVARKVAFGGAFGLGAIAAGALKGTVEASELGKAFEYLTRTLGDGLAPYVRMVTKGITELATWFGNLDQTTKDNVTSWALLTAGIAAGVAVVPLMVRAVAGLVGVLGLLTSPVALFVAALGVAATAAGSFFDTEVSQGQDAADGLSEANQTWLGALLKGLQVMSVVAARAFNWLSGKLAEISDAFARLFAEIGERTGILPAGTVEQLKAMPAMQGPQIDVGGVDNFFQKVRRGANAAKQDFGGFVTQILGLQAAFAPGGVWDRIKAAGGKGGFDHKYKVELEGFQQSWDRLQKALGANAGVSVQEKQLDEQRKINEGIHLAVAGINNLIGLGPWVR